MSSPDELAHKNNAKTAYFASLGASTLSALRLHREQGLWNRDATGQREWGNVSEHCLVEVARIKEFSDILGFDAELTRDAMNAAAVHDFYKKSEVAKLRREGSTWEAYADAQVEAKVLLDASELNERVVELATSVGHETLSRAEALSQKPELTPDEKAWLVMHYVDDYTINSDPVSPASFEDGRQVNDLERHMLQNKQNAQPGGKYHGIQAAGIEHLGEPTYDAQYRIGALVEQRLSVLVSDAVGQTIEPYALPEFIDQQVTANYS